MGQQPILQDLGGRPMQCPENDGKIVGFAKGNPCLVEKSVMAVLSNLLEFGKMNIY
jgi:hypothetical protein